MFRIFIVLVVFHAHGCGNVEVFFISYEMHEELITECLAARSFGKVLKSEVST